MTVTSRRKWLKTSLLAAGGAALAGCDRVADPYSLPRPEVPGSKGKLRGEERWALSTCSQCPAGCGIKVRIVEGRVVKLEGQRDHPHNRGGLCARGQASIDVLYNAARARGPLKRAGAKGEGRWEPISWEKAIEQLGERLATLRAGGDAHRLAVLSGRERSVMVDLWARFCRAYGTPSFVDASRLGSSSLFATAMRLSTGSELLPAYDLLHSDYILSLGSGLADGSSTGCFGTRALADARFARSGRRPKLLHVGPGYSLTAATADEWLAATPGSLDVLALALAGQLVKQGRHDRQFLEQHTFGWSAFTDEEGQRHPGLEELLAQMTLEVASARTGLAPETITRLAAELAAAQSPVVLVDERSATTSNGLSVLRAGLALNAVLGRIGKEGGVLLDVAAPLAAWPEPSLDALALASLQKPRFDRAGLDQLPLALSAPEQLRPDNPELPEVLFSYFSNPGGSLGPKAIEALKAIPTVVSFSPYLDETALLADYVLPDPTAFERWDDARGAPAPHPVLGLHHPAVPAVHETRHTGDVVIELARAIGGATAGAFAWPDYKSALLERLQGLCAVETANIKEKTPEELVDQIKRVGFWCDSASRCGLPELATASKRFELFSQEVLARYRSAAARTGTRVEALVAGAGDGPDLDGACLGAPMRPSWEGSADQYPLLLLLQHTNDDGAGGPLPGVLEEIGDRLTGARWGAHLELNPRTAQEAGVADGELVEVASEAAKLKVRVRLFEGVAPGHARLPLGLPLAGGEGNPRQLLSRVPGQLGRVPLCAARVRLTKVTA